MRIEELDYDLPPELIAQEPPSLREDARLLVLEKAADRLEHAGIVHLPAYLEPGDLLVANDTRVIPARMLAARETGGQVEILFLEARAGGAWLALLRAGGTLAEGEALQVDEGLGVRLLAGEGDGRWLVEGTGADVPALMERCGRTPLPPYIRRGAMDSREAVDRERYQTVFAREAGAVAAPTAGLHLTPELLDALEAKGIRHAFVTLHVGLGTFAPIRSEQLEEHAMHAERYVVPESTAEAIRKTRAAGGRIVAVGTTTVRALEASALASPDGLPRAGSAETDLLIAPGFAFQVVQCLLTNFHLPRSTLLALVAAFAGRERILAAYRAAIERNYRFYSYGDAMLILP